MIVLDTNVLSEPLRPKPDPRVVRWLDAQHPQTLWLTSITMAEIRFGIAALPEGARQQRLRERFEGEVAPLFAGRILPFDDPASVHYAALQANARRSGRGLSPLDGMIAAICSTHGHILATRNVADFEDTGLTLLDPWA